MMKLKMLKKLILLIFILISVYINNKVLCGNIKTLYSSINIDLSNYLGKDSLQKFNTKLYYAALNGLIIPYSSDSIENYYSLNELSDRGQTMEIVKIPIDTNKGYYIDSVIHIPFNSQVIISNSIVFKISVDEKLDFTLDFLGISCDKINREVGYTLGIVPLFYVSIDDLKKLFGEKATGKLLNECYIAMLKEINNNKKTPPVNASNFHLYLGDFIGNYIQGDIIHEILTAVSGKSTINVKPCPAYTTCELKTKYKQKELQQKLDYLSLTFATSDSFKGYVCSSDSPYYALSYIWNYDSLNKIAMAKIKAIGLYVDYIEKKKESIRFEPLFWLDWKDAEKIFSSPEITLLKYSFYRAFCDFNQYNSRKNWKWDGNENY